MLNASALNSYAINEDELLLRENQLDGAIDAVQFVVDGFVGELGLIVAAPESPVATVSGEVISQQFITANLSEPFDYVEGEMISGGAISAAMEQPIATVDGIMVGGNDIVMPVATVSGSVLTGNRLDASLTSTLAAVSSNGLAGNTMEADITGASPTVSAVAATNPDVALDAPMHEMAGTILSGAVLAASLSATVQEMEAIVVSDVISTAAITAIMPQVAGVGAVFYPPVAEPEVPDETPYEINNGFTGYAMNVENAWVSRYPGFRALAIARVGDMHLAVAPDGVYLLDGDTDDGEDIMARVRFGEEDFGSDYQKRIQYAYVGSRGSAQMRMFVDGDRSTSLHDVTHEGNGIGNRRIKMGKGTKSRYWQPEITGSKFEIDSIGLEPEALTRRVS